MRRSEHVDEDRLTDLARARARAEFAEWSAMLDYAVRLEATYNANENTEFGRQANIATIALEIGVAVGLSEHQVHRRLSVAERARDNAPHTWEAFRSGLIDAARVTVISDAIDKLKREKSIARLDGRVVEYASSHTVPELRRWLRWFIARVEADLMTERAEDERTKRGVHLEHGDDGMSWLSAYLPSFMAAAIDKRLTKEAKALGAVDERNTQQRRADLLAAWATATELGEAAVGADVAVTISAEAMAGINHDPIVSADQSWVMPAEWITDLAKNGDTFWHRIITDPAGRTLDHTYYGRFAPSVLAKAIAFRDGVCQAPGCCRPADQCDLDHRTPWPEGPTVGANLWLLCRRHHILKGHGVIVWQLPSGTQKPAEQVSYARAA